jgi:hypothetical protein
LNTQASGKDRARISLEANLEESNKQFDELKQEA